MKTTPLPDTRIRGGYAVTNVEWTRFDEPIEVDDGLIYGNVHGLFDPQREIWRADGKHYKAETDDDSRNLILTDEHRRLIAESKGGKE